MCCVGVQGGGGGGEVGGRVAFFSDKLICPVRKEIRVASILIIDIIIIILSIYNAPAFNLLTLDFNVTFSETRGRLQHLSYSMR